MHEENVAAIFVMSLIRARRALGSLVVFVRRDRPLSEEDCILLELVAEQLSAYIATIHSSERGWPAQKIDVMRLDAEQAGEKLVALLDGGLVGVFSSMGGGAVEGINDALLQLAGRSRAELSAEPLSYELLFGAPLTDAMVNEQKLLERFLMRRDGARVPVLVGLLRLAAEGRLLGIVVDVTEQNRRAERAEMLLAIVSHDLRSPLAAVRLAATILLAEELTPRHRKIVQRLDSASSQLTRLVQDLLDFTAARGDGIKLVHGAADVHDIARGTIEHVRATWPLRKIEHVCTGDGAATLDADRLAQVVANLVGNALQHSPPSSTVTVETRGNRDGLQVSVTNPGEPISAELMPVLFAPLKRGRAAGERLGSSGLGLFIAQQLILAHGGSIEVASNHPDAITFRVTLPRVPPVAIVSALQVDASQEL